MMRKNHNINKSIPGIGSGFTLAELLIALAILGVIAAFSIPKILQAQADQQRNAITREFMATLSNAYQLYAMNNTVPTNVNLANTLAGYMNYVKVTTLSTDYDDWTGVLGSVSGGCSTRTCLRFANGSVVRMDNGVPSQTTFSGTSTTNSIAVGFDPDGQENGSREVMLVLYYNGAIRTSGTIQTNTLFGSALFAPGSRPDPPWFSWN